MSPEQVKQLIEQAIPDSRAIVDGEGCNFTVKVISEAFAGKTMMMEHRMVYAAVDEHIKSGELHALTIKAYTPEEWEALIDR